MSPAVPGPPHGGLPPLVVGPPAADVGAALVLVHGRGGSPEGILSLAEALGESDLPVLAPRAAGNTWYPQSFLAPVEANEPGLSSGLAVLDSLLEGLADDGVPADRVVLAGFSQGACLTLEYVARHPRRFGAVAGLTGGLVGPPGSLGGYVGTLEGTPVLLASGDPDPHVPWERVEETGAILEELGGEVTLRRYPGRPHSVGPREVELLAALVAGVIDGG